MESKIIIQEDIKVPSKNLHEYEDYCKERIRIIEKKLYQGVGYIIKILEFIEIRYDDQYSFDNDGSILFKVKCKVLCIIPKENDIIECEISHNATIMCSLNDYWRIIIPRPYDDHEKIDTYQVGDKVSVKIEAFKFDFSINKIMMVASLQECDTDPYWAFI